ncbi:hypothetical protein J8I87_41610 [Paraburkholderia sp. LEh10]|uniref:hypothetical protein n=1 Tax=Paraburkholderia sp. LEh10 TaxID=2821353 RepID=UPI001AEAE976|nr:hypothetical protein [Paraburkholderia sp. LEh10]MBP0596004.1 hypothetical protein [Paraburkholderia sp. LEh10]
MSVLYPSHRLMLATGNEWHKIAALLLMKLPGEEARITVVAKAAGEASWNGEGGEAVLDGNGRSAWIRLDYR